MKFYDILRDIGYEIGDHPEIKEILIHDYELFERDEEIVTIKLGRVPDDRVRDINFPPRWLIWL